MTTQIDTTSLHANLVEHSPHAVILAGADGAVMVWNEAAERIFGYSAEEAMGQSLDIIVPEKFREAHWTGYDHALAAGETKYAGKAMPTKAVRKDGKEIYVELSFAMIHQGDEVVGALALAQDITERFESDRAQRRRVRELEAELEELRASKS
jgi:PAS domain S-box-containing protein